VIELIHGQVALAVGVDPDQRALVGHRVPVLQRATGLMERLPFSDGSLDLVVCSWVLEHLAQPQHAFAEVARVLQGPDAASGRPGGHFVFLAPNGWHPLTWTSRFLGRIGDWQARLVSRLYGRADVDTFPVVYRANTRRQLERLARAAGLTPVSLNTVGDPTYLAFNAPLYCLAVLVERLTPRWMKVHLVGDFVKKERF
jgi:SAM-dependent methyltransferase